MIKVLSCFVSRIRNKRNSARIQNLINVLQTNYRRVKDMNVSSAFRITSKVHSTLGSNIKQTCLMIKNESKVIKLVNIVKKLMQDAIGNNITTNLKGLHKILVRRYQLFKKRCQNL